MRRRCLDDVLLVISPETDCIVCQSGIVLGGIVYIVCQSGLGTGRGCIVCQSGLGTGRDCIVCKSGLVLGGDVHHP